MFNEFFNKESKEQLKEQIRINKYYQQKLANIFNTPDGKAVLSWLVKTHIFGAKAQNNCTELQHAYNNGKLDFIILLVNIIGYDFSNFEEKING